MVTHVFLTFLPYCLSQGNRNKYHTKWKKSRILFTLLPPDDLLVFEFGKKCRSRPNLGKIRNKLGLSCAKLRASLNLSGFDYIVWIWSEKILGKEKFSIKKKFGSKKILGPKNIFGLQKILVKKNVWSKKKFWSEKNFAQKKMLGLKKNGLKATFY